MSSKRLLLSLKHYIGDAVMTEPLVEALEGAYPEMEILAHGLVDQVLWHPNRTRSFLKLPRVHSPWAVVAQALALRKKRFDVAVLVNHSFRSALTIRLAGVPRRIGHPTEGRGWLLTERVPYDSDRFEAECLLDLARQIGIEATPRKPQLTVTDAELARGANLKAGASVGIQVGARYPEKQLPIGVTSEIARQLVSRGRGLAFLGGPEERPDAEAVANTLQSPIVMLAGATDLRTTLGVLASLEVMIGSDTGLMHLAAGVGCPTVTVFGPTPSSKWGHAYPPNRVLNAPGGKMCKTEPTPVLEAICEVLAQR